MSKVYKMNIREERLKNNCKCGKDTTNNTSCKCTTKKEDNPHGDHFNEIFNSGFNRR